MLLSDWRTIVLALVLAAGGVAVGRATTEAPVPLRLISQIPGANKDDFIATIDGVIKPILLPFNNEYRFVLSAPPPHAQLVFSIGLRHSSEPSSVRFEVLLQPPSGAPVSLYAQELHAPGWSDERIDLAGRDLTGATLILRRTPLSGPRNNANGLWGNPMLLPGTPRQRTSVILVSIDTLRADFTGPYGHGSARTPALDRLAREGTMYEQAYSPSTWTVPSHVSLFYGTNIPETPGVLRRTERVPADFHIPNRPLAAILRHAGYLAAGFTGGGFLDWTYDLPRGFDTYFAYQQPPLTACTSQRFDGLSVFPRALQWLRTNHQQPFFLFIHTYDVHDRCPFVPGGTAVLGWPELPAKRQRMLLNYYDRLIARTDRRIAWLLDTVDRLGLRDSTLVIVTSDHGEAFSEHGDRGHGCALKPYEELSHVPLLLRLPQRVPAGARIAAPVSLIDVAPTALALLGLPREPWMEGDLLPGLGLVPTGRDDRPVFVHCGDALSVRRGSFKLITSRSARYPDELYDLAHDAGEERSLRDHGAVRVQLLADAAQYWTDAISPAITPAAGPGTIDESTRERLRALGYVK